MTSCNVTQDNKETILSNDKSKMPEEFDIHSRHRGTDARCSAVAISFNVANKGINFGHLNIQSICGQNVSKFSELK